MTASSPLVSKVLDRKRRLHESRSKWKWALANLFGAGVVFVEAHSMHFMLGEESSWRTSVSRFENIIMIILLTNALLDLICHLFPYLNLTSLFVGDASDCGWDKDLVLTEKQMELFGIGKNDQGFKLLDESKKNDEKKERESGHPFGFGPPLEGSFITSTPGSYSPYLKSPSNASLDSSSWHFYRPSVAAESNSPKKEANQAYSPKFLSSLQGKIVKDQKSLSQLLDEYDSWEKSHRKVNASSVSLNDEGDLSHSLSMTSPSIWRHGQVSPLGRNLSPQAQRQDYSPFLKKMAYQVSSPMPESPFESATANNQTKLASTPKSPSSASSSANESICTRLGVRPVELVTYLENLRMWISQTVLRRIVDEIEKTNDLLVSHGMSDERIGMIGIDKLKKVGLMPHILQHVPSLDALIPFLEFHGNQEYLVKRYRELSEGGALSEFRWNAGGKFKNWEWNDKLPTDAEIVMNAVAAYLDTRLPSNFVSNDGKPFTGVYYVKFSPAEVSAAKDAEAAGSAKPMHSLRSKLSPDIEALLALRPKTPEADRGGGEEADKDPGKGESVTKDRGCVIVQVAQKPPRFELHFKDPKVKRKGSNKRNDGKSSKGGDDVEKIEVGPGRNNLFHTILLFLQHIKTREGGTLERINFGASGVNLLWVIGEE